MIRHPPRSPLFPYPTLFRSVRAFQDFDVTVARRDPARGHLSDQFPHALEPWIAGMRELIRDRKSTRLNSSHSQISYAVFCLKKKTNTPSCSPSSRTTSGPSR